MTVIRIPRKDGTFELRDVTLNNDEELEEVLMSLPDYSFEEVPLDEIIHSTGLTEKQEKCLKQVLRPYATEPGCYPLGDDVPLVLFIELYGKFLDENGNYFEQLAQMY